MKKIHFLLFSIATLVVLYILLRARFFSGEYAEYTLRFLSYIVGKLPILGLIYGFFHTTLGVVGGLNSALRDSPGFATDISNVDALIGAGKYRPSMTTNEISDKIDELRLENVQFGRSSFYLTLGITLIFIIGYAYIEILQPRGLGRWLICITMVSAIVTIISSIFLVFRYVIDPDIHITFQPRTFFLSRTSYFKLMTLVSTVGPPLFLWSIIKFMLTWSQ